MNPQTAFLRSALFFASVLISSATASAANAERVKFLVPEGSNKPLVTCSFDEQTIKSGCLIDTGSNKTALPGSLVNWAKKYPLKEESQASSAGSKSQCTLIEIENLGLGKLDFGPKSIARCEPFGSLGIIGMDFFAGKTWHFRFKKNEISEEGFIPENLEVFEILRSKGGHPYIPVEIADHQVHAMWDTGIGDIAWVDLRFIEQNPQHFKKIQSVQFKDATGKKNIAHLYSLRKMKLGKMTGKNLEVLATDFSKMPWLRKDNIPVIIGFGTAKWYNWHFDFDRNLGAIEYP